MASTLAVGTIVEFQVGSFLNTGEIMRVNPQSYRIEVRNVFGAKSVHTVRFEKIYRVIDYGDRNPDAAQDAMEQALADKERNPWYTRVGDADFDFIV